jgi:hypothetical protein
MARQPPPNPNGRKVNPLSTAPLTPEQLVRGIFQIGPKDVKRIVASRPGKQANEK